MLFLESRKLNQEHSSKVLAKSFISRALLILLAGLFCNGAKASEIELASMYSFEANAQLVQMLMQEVYKRAGVGVKFVMLPSARATQESTQGRLDGEVARICSYAEAHSELVAVQTPLRTLTIAAYSNRNRPLDISGPEQLEGLKVGIVRGRRFSAELASRARAVYEVDSPKVLFDMLSRDRMDVAVVEALSGRILTPNPAYKDVSFAGVLGKTNQCHILNRRHAELAKTLDGIIKSMKETGELASLEQKYSKQILSRSMQR